MTKTGEGLARWAENAVSDGKHVYCYGTYCNPFTADLLRRKTAQYPKHYTDARMKAYNSYVNARKIATDCVGLIKGYLWEENGSIKYGRNGIPDVSAEGMYKECVVKGAINAATRLPRGALVFTQEKDGDIPHVGIYVGNGYVCEARSFSGGMQKNELAKRTFTLWGLCPFVEYETETPVHTEAPAATPSKNNAVLNDLPTVRYGNTGRVVKIMQTLLALKGCNFPKYGIDADFGKETLAAVKAFQKACTLTVDGIVGPKTWAKLCE